MVKYFEYKSKKNSKTKNIVSTVKETSSTFSSTLSIYCELYGYYISTS